MSQKLWDGRFSEKTDHRVEVFSSSIDVDKRLYAYDIEGSVAHCKMLATVGIINDEEASILIEGLGRIKREIEHGDFVFDDSLEDIHMHIETRLLQQVGKTALKLHTARSRNDQIALDVRMFLRDATLGLIDLLLKLGEAFVTLAKKYIQVIVPGYTHLQRAQPVLLSHHLLAYFEMFMRDADRFFDGWERINVMPLGSAALAGTTYPIDRHLTAKLLNFPTISANSIDAVSDRDFIVEFLSTASLCMVHLSRISEELVLWSSYEFGFIELPDAFSTGSSIMPQKKNPDIPELIRGKTGRVFGDLIALLTTLKGLPLAYNRDMQEDKAPLFDAVETLTDCLELYIKMLPKIKIKREAMQKAAATGYLDATDLADYLTNKGMPFRDAHHCVGQIVGYAIENNKEINELSLDELQSYAALIKEDIYHILTPQQIIDRRRTHGGTATEKVNEAIAVGQKQLAKRRQKLAELYKNKS